MARTLLMKFLIAAPLGMAAANGVLAQEQGGITKVGPEELARINSEPLARVEGLWRVERVEGSAAATALEGHALRIDRQSVATLTGGTCTNPSFAERPGSILVNCLGQALAAIAWNPEAPAMITWSEGSLRAVLLRVSGTEALTPAASAIQPGEDVLVEEEAE
jgi:hypothetical protein